MKTTFALLALLATFAEPGNARAAVRVLVGPTPIPAASARAPGDITVVNEKLAFAVAVDSAAPYGVPRGALVAIAPVSQGKIGRNRVVFADFIPNNWSAWPNTYHRVDILERGPHQVRIRAVRDFGKATVTTLYTLRERSDFVDISTTLTNDSDMALSGLLSGLTLWPNSGFLFPVPGLAGVTEGTMDGALARRVVGYDADWTVTLHAPYADRIGSGSRDLLALTSLSPKESRQFNGWLQVGTSGDLSPVVAEEIELGHLPSGTVHGLVTTRDRKAVPQPVVVVEKDGKPYAWALGHEGAYRLRLPAGDYALYATARAASQSKRVHITVRAGTSELQSFHDLELGRSVHFSVVDARNGEPRDARIVITEGERPVVEFLGRKTFFTELNPRGYAEVPIAPGDYLFTVSAGGGFLAPAAEVRLALAPGATEEARVAITPLFDPRAHGWYSADLHHHADQAEAVTPPDVLARSQLAAGLDVLFVSDHDSTVNHAALQRIASERGVAFIPAIELSPSWGHFNAYPLTPGAKLEVDTSTASVDMILREARREGASVVQVNHPFIPYGYFASVDAGVAPGGFSGGFDVIEINGSVPGDDRKVLEKVWGFWNAGQHYYLAGGTDTHDAWNGESGRVRTFVHLDGAVTADSFAQGLKAGRAYVSYGPLVYPAEVFGSALRTQSGKPLTLDFDFASVAGLKEAQLISGGAVMEKRSFPGGPREAHASFAFKTERATWYALIVEDQQGRHAYTDPVWVAIDTPPTSQHPE